MVNHGPILRGVGLVDLGRFEQVVPGVARIVGLTSTPEINLKSIQSCLMRSTLQNKTTPATGVFKNLED